MPSVRADNERDYREGLFCFFGIRGTKKGVRCRIVYPPGVVVSEKLHSLLALSQIECQYLEIL